MCVNVFVGYSEIFRFISVSIFVYVRHVAYVPRRPEMEIKFLEVIGSYELPAGNET